MHDTPAKPQFLSLRHSTHWPRDASQKGAALEQSASETQPLQVFVVVSHISSVGQFRSPRHSTQVCEVGWQYRFGGAQSVDDAHETPPSAPAVAANKSPTANVAK
jgi:hypothetical protein